MKLAHNRTVYRLPRRTVEPAFGFAKQAMGFRHFGLRGLEKVEAEWSLVKLAYNCRRLHNMKLVLASISGTTGRLATPLQPSQRAGGSTVDVRRNSVETVATKAADGTEQSAPRKGPAPTSYAASTRSSPTGCQGITTRFRQRRLPPSRSSGLSVPRSGALTPFICRVTSPVKESPRTGWAQDGKSRIAMRRPLYRRRRAGVPTNVVHGQPEEAGSASSFSS